MPAVEAEPIKLKLKYRSNKSVKQIKSTSNRSGKKHRNKLGQNQKKLLPVQPNKRMNVNGLTGHRVMETV